MSITQLISAALVFLFLFGTTACNPDTPVKANTPAPTIAEQIPFFWETTSALRNGKPAASLEGLFFDFSSPGFVTTNLTSAKQTAAYKINGNKVEQLGDNKITYHIVEIDEKQMVLEMTLNETPFRFNLGKKTAEDH